MTTQFVSVDDDPPTTLTYAPRVSPAPLTASVPRRDPTPGGVDPLRDGRGVDVTLEKKTPQLAP